MTLSRNHGQRTATALAGEGVGAAVATSLERGIIGLRFHRRVLPTLAHLVRRDDALHLMR